VRIGGDHERYCGFSTTAGHESVIAPMAVRRSSATIVQVE
jgi:hypothetical protein